MSKGVYIFMGGMLALMIGAIVTTDHPKRAPERQPTYQDLADLRAAECVEHKGYDHWVGSSGVTLAQFCKEYGAVAALQQARHEHPEAF